MNPPPLREPAFLVLGALAAEPQHGYGLIERVRQASGGRVRLRTGSLYAVLDRLRRAGLIEPDRDEVVSGRLRRYYRITAVGARRLASETDRRRAPAGAGERGLRDLGFGGAA